MPGSTFPYVRRMFSTAMSRAEMLLKALAVLMLMCLTLRTSASTASTRVRAADAVSAEGPGSLAEVIRCTSVS